MESCSPGPCVPQKTRGWIINLSLRSFLFCDGLRLDFSGMSFHIYAPFIIVISISYMI